MQRYFLCLVLLPAMLLGACGGAEPAEVADGADGALGAVQAGAISAPADDPVYREPGDGPASPPAAELPIEPVETAAPPASSAAPESTTAAPPAEPQAPQQAGAGTADEILRRVERTYADVRSMQADFVQHLTVPLLGSRQRSQGRLYQRQPDRFLMRFSDPAGDIMVADGEYFWIYTPSIDRTQVLRTRIAEQGVPADLQQQFLADPTRRFVATLAGTETVDGRTTHVLSLVPRERSPYRLIRVWVDPQNHLVRRFELTEENESVRRIELRDLRLNVDLPDSLFRFSPPEGTQVFDQ